jgi:hypothetical protein
MSLNKTQIDALIDRNCKSNNISYPIADKTADENLAIDEVISIALKSSGRWQFDDTNHTDYPIITTDLVSGQRDYSFLTDEQGNLILDIYKILVAQPDGQYIEVYPIDIQSENNEDMTNGLNVQGIPCKYDKTGNGIFFDVVPSYSITGGIKIYINREGSYFTVNDTTKKPGFAGIFHEFVALSASYRYALRNSLPSLVGFNNDLERMRTEIINYYSNREKDSALVMTACEVNSI